MSASATGSLKHGAEMEEEERDGRFDMKPEQEEKRMQHFWRRACDAWRTSSDLRVFTVTISFSLLAVILFYFLVHRPLRDYTQAAEAETANVHREVVAVVNFKNAHPDRQAYEQELAQHVARAEAQLPRELQQGQLLQEIQQLALLHHVSLRRVLPAEAYQEGGLLVLPLQIACEADYFSLLDLLRDLRHAARFLKIAGIEMESCADGHIVCKLELRAYAMPA